MNYDDLKQLVNSLFVDEINILKSLLPVTEDPNSINKLIERERGSLCPNCGSTNVVKNGFKNGRQKFKCKDCNKYFSSNTNSILFKTNKSYSSWINFIHCEIMGLTLNEESHECGISQTTAFSWRHKLYHAITEVSKNVRLNGEIYIDGKFTSINLKGTKHENMPRYSKKRTSSAYRGISHHKVCILCAIDEHDNLVIKVAGTGRENTIMMENFHKYVEIPTRIICDDAHSLVTFAKKFKNIEIETIKSGTYKSYNGYCLSEINKIHAEIDTDLKCRNGVSLRHLQGYLDMYWFKKMLTYTVEYHDRTKQLFNKAASQYTKMYIKDIFLKAMPFDLKAVYADFKDKPNK